MTLNFVRACTRVAPQPLQPGEEGLSLDTAHGLSSRLSCTIAEQVSKKALMTARGASCLYPTLSVQNAIHSSKLEHNVCQHNQQEKQGTHFISIDCRPVGKSFASILAYSETGGSEPLLTLYIM